MSIIKRFFMPDYMLKSEQKMQEHYNTKEFYSSFLMLALPFVLQNILSYAAHIIDSIMVSSIGYTAVAAINLSSQ